MKTKSIKWLIISPVLLLLMWLLQQYFTAPKPNPINTISQTESHSTPAPPTTNTSAELKNKLVEAIPSNTTNNNLKYTDSERNYLTIYKELELATSCSHFYQKNHQAKGDYDYIRQLNQAANHQTRNQNGATEKQILAMEKFVSACLALKAAVFRRAQITNEFPQYQFAYPVLVELRKEFKQSKAETQEEKHLAKSIQLSSQWQTSFERLIDVLQGQPKLEKPVRDMLTSEAQSITAQINRMYQSVDVIDPLEIQQLELQIKQIYEQISQRLPVDEANKNIAISAFKPINIQFERMLLTTYPESFKLVAQRLQINDKFDLKSDSLFENSMLSYIRTIMPWYQPPSQVLQEYAQIGDQQIFDLLIEPASLLYLCYLGDDCSSESPHVRYFCLGKYDFHTENYPSACGKPLVDFFTEDYLSPNQWQDVSTLFDFMVATYAP